MSPFDLDQSMQRALRRFGGRPSPPTRAPRSDRGVSRLPAGVLACVARVLSGPERPPTRDILARIEKGCRGKGLEPPSRATVYKLMNTVPCPTLRKGDLPPAVQAALHNLEAESRVPAHQVAFCCFNYGDLRAMGFAAGLPWLAIHQALRLPGYREKCRGPLEAVAAARGI
jgi:hypothetical protein